MPAPHKSLQLCRTWATATQVPCDGVVFVDARISGYGGTTPRLWKLKDTPSIDFSVYSVSDCHSDGRQQRIYELMLRGPSNTILSLHRFNCRCHGNEYCMPVLFRCPVESPPLQNGQVVEMGCRITDGTVRFLSMQPREVGKQANFIWAAMDIVHASYDVEGFLRPDDGTLLRLCIQGPLREVRNAFIGSVIQQSNAHSILEIGGGVGGDLHTWLGTNGLTRIMVVDPDSNALEEYTRRLAAMGNEQRPQFTFHPYGILDLPLCVGMDADCAVLHFSITQIVGCGRDAHRLIYALCRERHIRWVVIVVHDHLATGLPDPIDPCGVRCEVVQSTGCAEHPLLACECGGLCRKSATLRTRFAGTRMASDIHEYAFSSEAFLSAAAVVIPEMKFRLVRPFSDRGHWVLRSLTLIVITLP
jgi:hypothetical protein